MASGNDDRLENVIAGLEEWRKKITKSVGNKIKIGTIDGYIQELKRISDDEVDFAGFLTNIGNSVVETQRKLDKQSMAYLEEIKPNKQITPAIYRIPKVSANIKFGMRSVNAKGFNILVSKRKEEDEQMLNQSLDFEIISVPPPPDYHQQLSNDIPSIGMVFSFDERNAVFQAISNYDVDVSVQEGLNKAMLLADREKVLVLKVGPTIVKGLVDYLLFAANDKADKNVAIWYLRMDPEGRKKTTLESVLKLSADIRKGENKKILRDLILAQGKIQQDLLV